MATIDDVRVWCRGNRSHHVLAGDGWVPLARLHPTAKCPSCCDGATCPVCWNTVYEDEPEWEPVAVPEWTAESLAACFPDNSPVWLHVELPPGPWQDEHPDPFELPKSCATFPYDPARYGPARTDGTPPVSGAVRTAAEAQLSHGRSRAYVRRLLDVLYPVDPGPKIPPSKSDPWVWSRPPDAADWDTYITTPRNARHRLRDAALPRVKAWRQCPPPPNERNFSPPQWAAVVFARLGTTSSDASAGLLRGLLDGYVLPPQHALLLDLQADRIGPDPQRAWEAFAAAWDVLGSDSSSPAGPVALFL